MTLPAMQPAICDKEDLSDNPQQLPEKITQTHGVVVETSTRSHSDDKWSPSTPETDNSSSIDDSVTCVSSISKKLDDFLSQKLKFISLCPSDLQESSAAGVQVDQDNVIQTTSQQRTNLRQSVTVNHNGDKCSSSSPKTDNSSGIDCSVTCASTISKKLDDFLSQKLNCISLCPSDLQDANDEGVQVAKDNVIQATSELRQSTVDLNSFMDSANRFQLLLKHFASTAPLEPMKVSLGTIDRSIPAANLSSDPSPPDDKKYNLSLVFSDADTKTTHLSHYKSCHCSQASVTQIQHKEHILRAMPTHMQEPFGIWQEGPHPTYLGSRIHKKEDVQGRDSAIKHSCQTHKGSSVSCFEASVCQSLCQCAHCLPFSSDADLSRCPDRVWTLVQVFEDNAQEENEKRKCEGHKYTMQAARGKYKCSPQHIAGI